MISRGHYAGICVRKNMEIGWMEGNRVLGGIIETNAAEPELPKGGWRLRRDRAWDKQELIWGAHLKRDSQHKVVEQNLTQKYKFEQLYYFFRNTEPCPNYFPVTKSALKWVLCSSYTRNDAKLLLHPGWFR